MLKNLLGQLFKPEREAARRFAPVEDRLRSALGYQKTGRLVEAEAVLRAVLEEAPLNADVMHLLASNLMLQRKHIEAVALLERVTSLQPDGVEAYHNLAGALSALGKYDQAVLCFNKALELKPDFVAAFSNLGNTLITAGRLEEAELSYRRALESKPDFSEGHYNLGNLLRDLGRFDEAIESYRNAIAIDPHFHIAYENLIFALNFHPDYTPQAIYREHLGWAEHCAGLLTRLTARHGNSSHAERRLRVGYVSADFYSHSVAYFIEPVLAHHNRTDFEVWCYYVGEVRDGVSERFRRLADHWVDSALHTDDELAQRIRDDNIDILVDLAGHTKGNRLLVFARNPAPVKVTYLGYPTTTGLSAINYRITDWQVDPPGTEVLNAEKPVRMPNSYFCYRPPKVSPDVGQLPVLLTGHITFGSFNHSVKLSERVLELWAQVLKAVPGATLMLKAKGLANAGMLKHVRQRFARWGVATESLLLQGWEGNTESHLALYNRVDIAVDTYPYNGATTTCEALWMGVPVVTLRGPTHASRMGASLLAAVGLGELIAATPERYVETCVELAADKARLEAMRAGLRERMRASVLMDEAGFTRALETEYRRMWRAWCEQETFEEAMRM